jgi:UDP-N-acetylmuramoyl-L-alanyl-D-glutamate--2,6-diaminopimelate ligase
VTLAQLAAACGAELRGDGGLVATGITHRAQDAAPGLVFAALPGQRHHGLEFLGEALARGAVAVLSDRDPGAPFPWLKSPNPRRATALAAWALAGHPQRRLRLAGVTGTNGKSTVVDLIARIASAAGMVSGSFTTIAYSLPHRSVAATNTTPEATVLAPLLAELVDNGGRLAAVEISSHALALDRVAGLELDVAVWTNVSRDHLDFHRTMEEYVAAKHHLETYLRSEPRGRRVVNGDDPHLAPLRARPRSGDLTFGLDGENHVTARVSRQSLEGSLFTLQTPVGQVDVSLPLVGAHNILNALAAAAAALTLGFPLSAIHTGLTTARPLPGRLELVTTTPCPVLVDYAHTPDALTKVLGTLREITKGRIIAVFGAGGDKDQGKRGPMGETVGRLADVPIVTSDNPRSEDPQAIIAAVMEGVRRSGNPRALAIPDRREAIAAALAMADARCVVLIAGKGHETTQTFANHSIPFDDRQVARELAHRRRG